MFWESVGQVLISLFLLLVVLPVVLIGIVVPAVYSWFHAL
ncbi:MAG: hypothetical protein JWN70_3777 [Planctomycetaceae bacterium]|nr:hypothetical protein [Planctomycetaceae bacterium]